jgi:hypothetical protein
MMGFASLYPSCGRFNGELAALVRAANKTN